MTGLGGEGWRVQGVPAASLRSIRHCVLRARRARHANILVTGGDASLRAGVVLRIERSTEEPHVVYSMVLPGEEHELRRALQSWLGLDTARAPVECDRGTLLIEGVLRAAPDVQRLLLQLADRLAIGGRALAGASSGPARLAAGLEVDPALAAAAGLVRSPHLVALLDRLDKLRVDLGPMPQWSG